MRKKFSILSLACLPLLACGGDDANNKKISVPDAKVFKDGSGGGSCAVQPMYSALGQRGAVVDHPTGANAEYMQLYTTMTAGVGSAEGSDSSVALLFSGGTYWPSGITGGSGSAPITISASDGDYATCEICFFVSVGGFDGQGIKIADTSDVYLANSGTFMIQQRGVNNGSGGSAHLGDYFFATVTNLHFHHVSLDTTAGTSSEIPDGCTTTVGSGDYGYIPMGSSAALTDGLQIPVKVIQGKPSMAVKNAAVLSSRHI